MAVTQTQWIELSKPPFGNGTVSHLLMLNDTDILITVNDQFNNLAEIWTYNICNDNYSELISKINVTKNSCVSYYAASLNDHKSVLYLFGNNGKIIKINLKTKQFEISKNSYHCGSLSRSSFINGQLHIFGGLCDNGHHIWDENKKELIETHVFEQINNELDCHLIQYLKTQNCVLIIPDKCNEIYIYSLSTNKCEILPIKMVEPISYPSGVLSRNEQYMIVFSTRTTNIYVFDLKSQIMWKSKIEKGTFMNATIISDNKKEELLCFGFIRKCWKLSEFAQIRFITDYLIKIINAYFTIEIIHIMNGQKHFCINIDKFVESNNM